MGTLHFFPATFPDETLYSRLARYHRLSGYSTDRETLRELIGVHTHVVMSDLPSRLQILVSRIPTHTMCSVEGIINENTIFPYFQCFLPCERCNLAVTAMSGISTSSLKTSIGLVASRLGAKNPLRFCRYCLEEDQTRFGQGYWHRVHQLPGTWVCPKHASPLVEVDFKTVQLKRHKLFLPDDPVVELASRQILLSPLQIEMVLRIAKLSMSALLSPQSDWHGPNLNSLHRKNAGRNGLVSKGGRVRVVELANKLESYALGFPSAGEYMIVHNRFLDWVLRLLRRQRGRAVHPMKHLLLMDCLRGENNDSLRHVTQAPQSTLLKRVVRNHIDQTRLTDMLSDKRFSLQQAAAELGLSVTTVGIEAARLGLPVSRRPKTITEDIKMQVYASLRCGLTPKQVSEKHLLSQVSIYRILRMDKDFAREYTDQRFQQRRDTCRKHYASQTITRAEYAWLRRHDWEWLTGNRTKASMCEIQRRPYVDWAGRDKFLEHRIRQISEIMGTAPGKPNRVSRTALERAVGLTDTIERNATKLPLTHQALARCSESWDEYQSRRLYWAAGELKKSLCGPLPRWQLLRQAGIRVLARSNEQLVRHLTSA